MRIQQEMCKQPCLEGGMAMSGQRQPALSYHTTSNTDAENWISWLYRKYPGKCANMKIANQLKPCRAIKELKDFKREQKHEWQGGSDSKKKKKDLSNEGEVRRSLIQLFKTGFVNRNLAVIIGFNTKCYLGHFVVKFCSENPPLIFNLPVYDTKAVVM